MRVAVLSDIHSNYPALDVVLEDAKDRVDEYWLLGDAIGYGLQPVETLQALSEIPLDNMVKGNHEALFARETPPRGIQIGKEGLLMMEHNRSLIQGMQNCVLPSKEESKKQIDGANYYLVHSMEHIYEYINFWDDHQLEKMQRRIAGIDFQTTERPDEKKKFTLALVGHSHIPGIVYLDPDENKFKKIKVRSGIFENRKECRNSKLVILNPGSVGFPRDWIPHPSYLILDTHKLIFEFRRLDQYRMDANVSGYDDIVRNIRRYMDGVGVSRDEAENYIRGLKKAIIEASFPNDVFNLPLDWRKFYLESRKIYFKN